MNYDLHSIITNSKILKDARAYGYYVREQIEAHGSLMPDWLVDNLVEGAAHRTELAADFLANDCNLALFFEREVIMVALEAITVRDMDLESFCELLVLLIEESIDPPEDSE